MNRAHLEIGRELRRLGAPIREQRGRHHNQHGIRLEIALLLPEVDERQHLQGLAKAHIVSETGTDSRRERTTKIVDTGLLVGTQNDTESVWPIRSRINLRMRECFQEFPQLAIRPHLDVVVRTRRCRERIKTAARQEPKRLRHRDAFADELFRLLPMREQFADLLWIRHHPLAADAHESVTRFDEHPQLLLRQPFAVQGHADRKFAERPAVESAAGCLADRHRHLRLRRILRPQASCPDKESRRLVSRNAFQKAVGLADGEGARLEDAPCLQKRRQKAVFLRRRFERCENAAKCGGTARIGLQRGRKRQVTHLPIGIRTVHKGCKERKRTRSTLVALVLGEVERYLTEVAPA